MVGLVAWLAYRPSLEQSAHHGIAMFALPWLVVVLAIVLAIVATYFAASRPARSITKVPIVAALSGRPAPPRQIHRSAIPGIVFLVIAFVLLGVAGAGNGNGSSALALVFGIIALIPGVILLSPFLLSLMARLGRRAPIAVRLPLRDLSRYRARSDSALSAISLGILVAVIISIASASRYGNVLDYAGPNLASNQINVYTPNGPYGPGGPGNGSGNAVTTTQLNSMQKAVDSIATSLGSHEVAELEGTSANLQHAASGRQWSGPVYVATPQLLNAFGIKASQVSPNADLLTMRPGISTTTKMQLVYGNYFGNGSGPSRQSPNFLSVSEERLRCQSGDRRGERASVGDVRPEHRDYRARDPFTGAPADRIGLADSKPHSADRCADHRRTPDRGCSELEHRDAQQRAHLFGDRQLGDRLRCCARTRHPRHVGRPHPQ